MNYLSDNPSVKYSGFISVYVLISEYQRILIGENGSVLSGNVKQMNSTQLHRFQHMLICWGEKCCFSLIFMDHSRWLVTIIFRYFFKRRFEPSVPCLEKFQANFLVRKHSHSPQIANYFQAVRKLCWHSQLRYQLTQHEFCTWLDFLRNFL